MVFELSKEIERQRRTKLTSARALLFINLGLLTLFLQRTKRDNEIFLEWLKLP